MDSTSDVDDTELIERLHALATPAVPDEVADRQLSALAGPLPPAAPRRRGWRPVVAAGAASVAVLAGSTGLAAAGALPGPAQGIAHDILGPLGLDVPDQGRGECVAAVARPADPPPGTDHGTTVSAAAQDDCAPADVTVPPATVVPTGPDGDTGPPDGVPPGPPADRPDGVRQGPPDDLPVGPPSGAPNGPPAGTPVGPPPDVPQGPPADTPAGPPADTPTGPPAGTPVGPPAGVPNGPPDGVPPGPPADTPGGRP